MKAPRFVHLTYDKKTANDVIDNFIPIGLSREIALREKQTILSFIDELMEVGKGTRIIFVFIIIEIIYLTFFFCVNILLLFYGQYASCAIVICHPTTVMVQLCTIPVQSTKLAET